MADHIIDTRLAQSCRQFCRGGRRSPPNPGQLARMREVIANEYHRSSTHETSAMAPTLPASRRSATPQAVGSNGFWTKASERHLLPAVEKPYEVLTIPGAQRVGVQRGAGECGVLCVRKSTTINFDPCEHGDEHFISWTKHIHKLAGHKNHVPKQRGLNSRQRKRLPLQADRDIIAAQEDMHPTVGRSQPSRVQLR